MRKSKIKTLVLASVMIMLCAAMIVGGTYALWSDSVTVTNHLSAGKLDVKLERTYLEKHMLGDDMRMTDTTNSDVVNFSESTTENVFGIGSNELIVPTSSYSARLKLTNEGNVAVDYTVKIIVKDNSGQDLAKQLKVSIGNEENGNVTYDEGQFLASEGNDGVEYLTYTIAGGSMYTTATEFWVKVEFVDDDAINNEAQTQEVFFDLLVEATQKTN